MLEALCFWLSDDILFPALQALLCGVVLFSIAMEAWTRWRVGRGSMKGSAPAMDGSRVASYRLTGRPTQLVVTRSPATMPIYFGTYAAISGLLVALCFSSDYAQDHRVLWALVDVLAVFYLCLLNPWFRLKLLSFAKYLATVERR